LSKTGATSRSNVSQTTLPWLGDDSSVTQLPGGLFPITADHVAGWLFRSHNFSAIRIVRPAEVYCEYQLPGERVHEKTADRCITSE
jgi:hypothetical protein